MLRCQVLWRAGRIIQSQDFGSQFPCLVNLLKYSETCESSESDDESDLAIFTFKLSRKLLRAFTFPGCPTAAKVMRGVTILNHPDRANPQGTNARRNIRHSLASGLL